MQPPTRGATAATLRERRKRRVEAGRPFAATFLSLRACSATPTRDNAPRPRDCACFLVHFERYVEGECTREANDNYIEFRPRFTAATTGGKLPLARYRAVALMHK